MQYSIFKLSFKAPVHFGNGRLSNSLNTFYADTLFSAMYKEAIKLYGEKDADKLRQYVLDGELRLSDAMPFCEDELFIPKPIIHIGGTRESDSSMKKKFKKLKYIPAADLNEYLSGSYDPTAANDVINDMGKYDIAAKVAVIPGEDSLPYNVGTFTFDTEKGYGLYFVMGGTDDGYDMVYDIMDSLSYTGIGGKVSAGCGKFEYTYNNAAAEMEKALTGTHKHYMSLSVSMAENEAETEKALDGSYYELVKRSGFVSSESYSDNQMKKRDFYVFKAGSCFADRFSGSVFDVSEGGRHSVYRYAVPMFYGFD